MKPREENSEYRDGRTPSRELQLQQKQTLLRQPHKAPKIWTNQQKGKRKAIARYKWRKARVSRREIYFKNAKCANDDDQLGRNM
jgi:hypothetical protein